jgi:hypothetical protein
LKNLIIIISSIFIIFILGTISSHSTEHDGIIFGNILAKASVAESDSVEKTNIISKVWINNNTLHYKVILDEADYKIQIDIYNMLAKPVDTIFDRIANATFLEVDDYDVSSLPPGPYFLVLTGPGFRHVEKFILTR